MVAGVGRLISGALAAGVTLVRLCDRNRVLDSLVLGA
jgi:hypothetical protein